MSDTCREPYHVEDEARSPVDGDVYTMLCGVTVGVAEDGQLSRDMDFYGPNSWHLAECPTCRKLGRGYHGPFHERQTDTPPHSH